MVAASKPDPAQGVFETMLIRAGAPVELDAHLRRLAVSLRALYGMELPVEAASLVRSGARGLELGRVRLTVVPGAGHPACEAVAGTLEPELALPGGDGVALWSFALPGGLGAHKWADRSLLPTGPDGTVPLLLEADGEVLEAGWANAFAVHDGVLRTPPLDGRILPGVTRAAALAAAREEGIEIEERRLERDELLGADEVFVTSSLRGAQAARSLDGTPLPAGEVSGLLAPRLARRYGTLRTAPLEASRSA